MQRASMRVGRATIGTCSRRRFRRTDSGEVERQSRHRSRLGRFT
jgi:hypothetical protein